MLRSNLAFCAVVMAGVACSLPARCEDKPAEAGAEQRLIKRFRLFPGLTPAQCCDLSAGPLEPRRLLHQPGDPDSLFTIGSPSPQGELRFQAAVEVSDVVLKALAPDLNVDPSDTKFRPSGDYRALDKTGRPYQFRLGAKFVW